LTQSKALSEPLMLFKTVVKIQQLDDATTA